MYFPKYLFLKLLDKNIWKWANRFSCFSAIRCAISWMFWHVWRVEWIVWLSPINKIKHYVARQTAIFKCGQGTMWYLIAAGTDKPDQWKGLDCKFHTFVEAPGINMHFFKLICKAFYSQFSYQKWCLFFYCAKPFVLLFCAIYAKQDTRNTTYKQKSHAAMELWRRATESILHDCRSPWS